MQDKSWATFARAHPELCMLDFYKAVEHVLRESGAYMSIVAIQDAVFELGADVSFQQVRRALLRFEELGLVLRTTVRDREKVDAEYRTNYRRVRTGARSWLWTWVDERPSAEKYRRVQG